MDEMHIRVSIVYNYAVTYNICGLVYHSITLHVGHQTVVLRRVRRCVRRMKQKTNFDPFIERGRLTSQLSGFYPYPYLHLVSVCKWSR